MAGKRPNRSTVELTPQQWERLKALKERDGLKVSEHIRRAVDRYLTEKEDTMTTITCRPGESVFEAVDRAIANGTLPAGSAAAHFRETCEDQVAVVKVRPGERVPVRGPQPE